MKKISLEKYFVALSRDSLIYGLGNAVLRILALLTAPIFTRVFIPAEYGIISLIASVISFLSIFLIFGMDNAIFISFYQYKNQRKTVISSAFWFLLLWGLFLVGVASLFSQNFSEIIFKTPTYKILFLLTFWTAYLTLLVNLAKIIFRLQFRAKTFATVAILNALLSTGLMILFVVYLKKGLTGYFTGSLIGTAVSVLLALFLIRTNLEWKISWSRLKEMVIFGSYVLPASVSFFVFDLSDRFFLNHYRNLSEIGLYSIGINIASILVFFSYALGQAWAPMVLNIYYSSRKIFHQFVPRLLVYYLIFFFSLAALITLFGQEILRVFATPKFYGAAKVIGPLTIAMVFLASNQITCLGMTISRKMKYFAINTILAAVLNIVLNFILIPKYGMIGAGWATASSYLFLTLAYYFSSQKFIPLKIDWSKIIKLSFISLGVITFGSIFWRFSPFVNLVIKILEFAFFLILLYLFAIIEKQEIIYLKVSFKKLAKLVLRKRRNDY